MAPSSASPIRILMIHGYTQSGPFFRLKTRALEKNLIKAFPGRGVHLVYPTAPHKLAPQDVPTWDSAGNVVGIGPRAPTSEEEKKMEQELDAWTWWRIQRDKVPWLYEGFFEVSLPRIVQVLKDEGPFDGVIGFSQGAAVAAIVATLFENGRQEAFTAFEEEFKKGTWVQHALAGEEWKDLKFEPEKFPKCLLDEKGQRVHPPFKFAAAYSGFAAPHPRYTPFYYPKIQTPLCSFIGSLDTVVTEDRSMLLVNACQNGKLVYHPGGHFLPSSQRDVVGALVTFIRDNINPKETKPTEETSVEDMDMPF
jgi:hypothetical protein